MSGLKRLPKSRRRSWWMTENIECLLIFFNWFSTRRFDPFGSMNTLSHCKHDAQSNAKFIPLNYTASQNETWFGTWHYSRDGEVASINFCTTPLPHSIANGKNWRASCRALPCLGYKYNFPLFLRPTSLSCYPASSFCHSEQRAHFVRAPLRHAILINQEFT